MATLLTDEQIVWDMYITVGDGLPYDDCEDFHRPHFLLFQNWLSWEQVSSLLILDGRARRPLLLAAHLLLDVVNRSAADVVNFVWR
jgi:hypothetical protein